MIFEDYFSDYVSVAFFKHKCDTLKHFKKFLALSENKHSTSVKALRLDNSRECINRHSEIFLIEKGIKLENTALTLLNRKEEQKKT